MKLYIISFFSFVNNFPAPTIPNADIEDTGMRYIITVEHQSDEILRCISETRNHFVEEVVAMGGSPTDRLAFSASQIRQLCIASVTHQISETTVSPPTTQVITEITTSENGIDQIIDLLQQLESFKNMLNPEK